MLEASIRNVRPLGSYGFGIDPVLMDVVEQLRLPDHLREKAETSYLALSEWLTHEKSVFCEMDHNIYLQGSFRTGTAIKKLNSSEFDADAVLEFRFKDPSVICPMKLLDAVFLRFSQSDVYGKMIRKKNRCVQVVYANEFHFDILPAAKEFLHDSSCTRILVPDRSSSDWKHSNPKGYSDWFVSRERLLEEKLAKAYVEPFPDEVPVSELSSLACMVQLLKRHRDLYYTAYAGINPPISIVITTLSASGYTGTGSLIVALENFCSYVTGLLPSSPGERLVVVNPSNDDEDFSEKWDDDKVDYFQFKSWIQELMRQLEFLRDVTVDGRQKEILLEKMFGEDVVRGAISSNARKALRLREQGKVLVTGRIVQGASSLGLAVPVSASAARVGATAIKNHTFFGD